MTKDRADPSWEAFAPEGNRGRISFSAAWPVVE